MITSLNNQQVKRVRALQSRRDARLSEHAYVIEGTRLIEEALQAGLTPSLVLYTESWAARYPGLVERASRAVGQTELVSEAVLARCSDVETPQGVLAVVPMPAAEAPQSPSLTLLLDRIADPGNLGTLLRAALAAAVETVLLTPGSVDLYNPKVIRAAMGAHFRLTAEEIALEDLPTALDGQQLWAASARQGTAYHQVDWTPPVALAIGSEAHGLSAGLLEMAAGRVHIPIVSASESINAAAAAAVILFEIRRQRGF